MTAGTDSATVGASLARSPIVGVVRTDALDSARAHARALMAGGLELVEVTFTVPGASGLVRELLDERSGAAPPWIGMGSVTTEAKALEAAAAGAEFLVSPNVSTAVAGVAKAEGLFLVMGAMTPSEIVAAAALGADLVKVYPLPALGGPRYLATIRGPLYDIEMLAAGGFGVDEIPAYRQVGARAFGLAAQLLLDGPGDATETIHHARSLARGDA